MNNFGLWVYFSFHTHKRTQIPNLPFWTIYEVIKVGVTIERVDFFLTVTITFQHYFIFKYGVSSDGLNLDRKKGYIS